MTQKDATQDIDKLLGAAEMLEAFVVDVNGIPRGKRIPRDNAGKIFKDGLRLPRSVYAVDVWGQDVLPAGLVAQTGDNDGVAQAVTRTVSAVPWLDNPAVQVILSMREPDGAPFFGDPRHVLQKTLDDFAADGLTPVVAAEIEFYLYDPASQSPQPPLSPRTGKRAAGAHILSLDEVNEYDAVLSDIAGFCKAQDIPADTTISENGPGQFEINLNHVPDALMAADHAVLLKRVIRGAARRHGMDATFMAKPYGDQSGNGMHVHFSVLDKDGKNIFAGDDEKGSEALRHALGGLLATMADCTAVFAPNLNSYRRFRAGSHAPTNMAWGYDNRSAALRVPQSDLAATRIEHRVAGADANPYLLLSVILAGALHGLRGKIDPGPPAAGNVYESGAQRLPATWDAALDVFENSGFITRMWGEDYKKLYLACKWQEKDILDAAVTSAEHDAYLRDI